MIITYDREMFLNEVFRMLHRNIDAVEIGIFNGDFSKEILERLKPSTLVLVDPFEHNETLYPDGLTTAYSSNDNYEKVRERFKKEIADFNVIVDGNYSYNAVKKYADDSFDFIYHDASHLYEDLKRDLNDWLPKLTENGLMCGHDYGAIFEGVKQAVDEFCIEHNFEMIILNENGGDFALRRNNG